MTGELDVLEIEAQTVDAQIAQPITDLNPPPDTEAALKVDRLAEARALIGILQPLIVMALPCVKDAPDEEWQALHQPVAECLAFYDVDVSKWLAHPLAALAFAAVPLVMRGVNNWRAQAENSAPDKKPEAVPGSPGEPAQDIIQRA